MSDPNRIIRLADLDIIVADMREFYDTWKEKGIITKDERSQLDLTLDTLTNRAKFMSIPEKSIEPLTAEKQENIA